MLVVVLAGLLLGGVLAHFFGGARNAPAPGPSTVAVVSPPLTTPAPIATPSPAIAPTRSTSPSPSATAPATHKPSPKPVSSASALASVPASPLPSRKPVAPTATPAPAASVAAVPAPVHSAPPHTAPPHPALPSGNSRASAIVRSYLEALGRGDRATAASYLARGSPNETFINGESRIESISSANVGPQQYRVGADVQTSTGEYFITFTLEQGPGGLQIIDHSSIKPQ